MVKGYCMKCKRMVEIESERVTKTSRGTRMTKGKCGRCGTTVCKMG